MSDKPSPNQHPDPNAPRDWDAASEQDIDQKLARAAELAGELSNEVGDVPPLRELRGRARGDSGIQKVEKELDIELKELEHLVGETKNEIGNGAPVQAALTPRSTQPVPDFMSEFMSPETEKAAEPTPAHPGGTSTGFPAPQPPSPITEPFSKQQAKPPLPSRSSAAEGRLPAAAASESRPTATAVQSPKPGIAGTEPLRALEDVTKIQIPPSPAAGTAAATDAQKSAGPENKGVPWGAVLLKVCDSGVGVLETLDRPFVRLGGRFRSILGLIAIATAGIAIVAFIISLL